MKILLIKMSSMGDILHTLPALTDAQKQIPNLQIDWVVEKGFSEIPVWHSAVNQIIPIKLRYWRKHLFEKNTWQEWKQFKQIIKSNKYDLIIDAQGLVKSAYLTRLNSATSHGYDKHSARESLAAYFYDNKYDISYQQHAVTRIRKLFAKSLGYTYSDVQGDYGVANQFIQQNLQAENYLMFFHGTTKDSKHWTENAWRELIAMVGLVGFRVKLAWGNDIEYQRAQRLSENFSHVEVLPKSTLTELAVQIANAKACVSVDTGLSHLAAALDKTNITLFGPTDPKLVGGYGLNQNPIKKATMADISAQEVFDKLKTCLNFIF